MKPDEKIIASATRLEFEEKTGKMYIVFEVIDEQYKLFLKKNWTKDLEYKLIDRDLVENNE